MGEVDASALLVLRSIEEEGKSPIENGTPEIARTDYLNSYSNVQNPLEDVVSDDEIYIGKMRCKIWRGKRASKTNSPSLLYMHGGGWVIGAPETHEDICRSLANRAGIVVVSPDYRLAPEHPYPAAINDCCIALNYMTSEASILGIDPARIAIGGDSAGGNLAAVLAIMSRDRLLPPVIAQLLIYPVTDARQSSVSYSRLGEGFGLTASAMRWFRDQYITKDEDIANWRVSPLLVDSLENIAPAIVVLAGQDVLYDEGEQYADRLASEASAIKLVWPGQIHGFMSMGKNIPEANDAMNALWAAWKDIDPRVT